MNNEPSESTDIDNTPAEQVLTVPGYLFFSESFDIPEDLDDSELADFAELSLESIAPFPLDQLLWGFIRGTDSNRILLYAAHRDRIKSANLNDLDTYDWVLPDFAMLAGALFPEDTEILLESEASLTRLNFETGIEQPHSIISLKSEGVDSTSSTIQKLERLCPPSPTKPRRLHIKLGNSEIDDQGQCVFKFESIDSPDRDSEFGKWVELKPSDESLWTADIRSLEFKQNERKNRQTSAFLSKIGGYAAVFAILLFLAEILLIGGNIWKKSLDAKIVNRAPAVRTIEDKQSLMNKLEQVAQNELQPIKILSVLNKVRLNQKLGIHFTEAEIEGENRVTIEGISQTVNELNRYKDILLSSGEFSLLDQPKSMTRGGVTTFTLSFSFDASAETNNSNEAPPIAEESSNENSELEGEI